MGLQHTTGSWEEAMKKPSVLAIALAAILYATPLSLHWSNEVPSVSVDKANAQNRVHVNRRPARPLYGPNGPYFAGNPYVNYRYLNPYVNYGNPYVNPWVNRR
jgi:hypothetical protein